VEGKEGVMIYAHAASSAGRPGALKWLLWPLQVRSLQMSVALAYVNDEYSENKFKTTQALELALRVRQQ